MLPRHAIHRVHEAQQHPKVLLLTAHRQAGNPGLARSIVQKSLSCLTLNDVTTPSAAKSDPGRG